MGVLLGQHQGRSRYVGEGAHQNPQLVSVDRTLISRMMTRLRSVRPGGTRSAAAAAAARGICSLCRRNLCRSLRQLFGRAIASHGRAAQRHRGYGANEDRQVERRGDETGLSDAPGSGLLADFRCVSRRHDQPIGVHRSEFHSILQREGVDGLVMALNRKVDLLQSVARRRVLVAVVVLSRHCLHRFSSAR